MDFATELKLWNMEVTLISIRVSALETVLKGKKIKSVDWKLDKD